MKSDTLKTTTLYGVVRPTWTVYEGTPWAAWAPGDTRESARRSGKHQDHPEGLPTGATVRYYDLVYDDRGEPLTFRSLEAARAEAGRRPGTEVKVVRGVAALIA